MNHNVKIKVVNDSKEIAVIVYFTTLTIMESLVLGFLVPSSQRVSNVGLFMTAATVIIGITFVPKGSLLFIIANCLPSDNWQ